MATSAHRYYSIQSALPRFERLSSIKHLCQLVVVIVKTLYQQLAAIAARQRSPYYRHEVADGRTIYQKTFQWAA